MTAFKRWLTVVLVCVAPLAAAIDPVAFDDPAHDARYRALLEELRCVVCQNQTLAESNAPLAVDLREQVRVRIEAGASDREIVEYLTARYGDFVLYRPPLNAVTALLWFSPLLLLLVGSVFAWRLLRAPPTARPLDPAERSRVRTLLGGRSNDSDPDDGRGV